MKIYTTTDYTGATCKHMACGKKEAIQAHLHHFGLFYLKDEFEIVKQELEDIKDRSIVCWDVTCCLIGATKLQKE